MTIWVRAVRGRKHPCTNSDPTLTPHFRIYFPISHLWAARTSLALRMRGSDGFLLFTDWATEHATEGAVER